MIIEEIALEVHRPGPPHGQLLSPLTQYVALCEDHGPVTFQVTMEHWDLLDHLSLLRYQVVGADGTVQPVDDTLRETTLRRLGRMVRDILADLVTVPAELGRAIGSASELVHLRLNMTGSELALIPFELGIAPLGYPGEGVELLLQRRVPTIITREARRGRASPLDWDRDPRVLFVAAQPDGNTVPLREHLHAVRDALDPWIARCDTPEERLEATRGRLTVLTDASLASINDACRKGEYTHVHILAHGAASRHTHQQQFGVLLCASDGSGRGEVVDGRRLAQALQPDLADGTPSRRRPSVVTLATCDSGNVGSVVAPGASVAHELQSFGIPLVFASQFPLTKRGSVGLVHELYQGLMRGDDPRVLLYNVRDNMCVDGHGDHDWASLVCYASLPSGFDEQVQWFRARQVRKAVDVELDWAQRRGDAATVDDLAQAERAIGRALALLDEWLAQLPHPDDASPADRKLIVECYGLTGATEKRAAEIVHGFGDRDADARTRLRKAMGWYRRAVDLDVTAHWPASQFLSLVAVVGDPPAPDLHRATLGWARQGVRTDDRSAQAWAHGTLAELAMLRLYHDPPRTAGDRREVVEQVDESCRRIVDLMGPASFHVQSTRRQFRRYVDWWRPEKLLAVAERAVAALGDDSQ